MNYKKFVSPSDFSKPIALYGSDYSIIACANNLRKLGYLKEINLIFQENDTSKFRNLNEELLKSLDVNIFFDEIKEIFINDSKIILKSNDQSLNFSKILYSPHLNHKFVNILGFSSDKPIYFLNKIKDENLKEFEKKEIVILGSQRIDLLEKFLKKENLKNFVFVEESQDFAKLGKNLSSFFVEEIEKKKGRVYLNSKIKVKKKKYF